MSVGITVSTLLFLPAVVAAASCPAGDWTPSPTHLNEAAHIHTDMC